MIFRVEGDTYRPSPGSGTTGRGRGTLERRRPSAARARDRRRPRDRGRRRPSTSPTWPPSRGGVAGADRPARSGCARPGGAAAPAGRAIGAIAPAAPEVRPFTDRADRPGGDLRRPGRDRHRERPAVHRAAGAQPRPDRGAGAADGHRRGAARHQPVAHRPAAGAGHHRRERAPACARRDRRGADLPRRGRHLPRRRRSTRVGSRASGGTPIPSVETRPMRGPGVDGATVHVADVAVRPERRVRGGADRRRAAHRACAPCWRCRCSAGRAIGAITIARTRCAPSPTSRSRCWRPSPTRP